jgi:hypothetical protein
MCCSVARGSRVGSWLVTSKTVLTERNVENQDELKRFIRKTSFSFVSPLPVLAKKAHPLDNLPVRINNPFG